jgi:hypothetical protein
MWLNRVGPDLHHHDPVHGQEAVTVVEEVGVELVPHRLQHLAAPTASQVSKQTGTDGKAQRAGSTRNEGGHKPTFNFDRKGIETLRSRRASLNTARRQT